MSAGAPAVVRLVRTAGLPVLRQLLLEEALLRADAGHWCLVNDGAASPTAVLGISGKPSVMLDTARVLRAGVPVVRRFSGGGTVLVDSDTQLVSFVFGSAAAPEVPQFPTPLMQWSERFYAGVFEELSDFRLRENDYVLGERKFGGNAQSIIKGRWVHHTSFLWDFQPAHLALLRHPPRMPAYRLDREHGDFVCRLRDRWPHRDMLGHRVARQLQRCGYAVLDTPLEAAEHLLERAHLSSSTLVDPLTGAALSGAP